MLIEPIARIEDGRSLRYVARVINVNVSTIQRAYQRFRETGLVLSAQGLDQDEKGQQQPRMIHL